MPLIRSTILALAALVLAGAARADHQITFVNNCPFALTPMWKDNADGASEHSAGLVAPGAQGSTTLPEIWNSGRFYAQDPKNTCLLPDGAQCTLTECSFGPGTGANRFWQCNLSVVSGYNVPTAYSFVGGDEPSCTGFSCTSPQCPITQAYRVEGCSGCINQCNTDNVGMRITYCPAGSTIPNMGQSASAPASKPPATTAKSSAPAPAPAPDAETSPAASAIAVESAPPSSAAAPATSTSSAALGVASAPTCSRSRRRARRAHARALQAHGLSA